MDSISKLECILKPSYFKQVIFSWPNFLLIKKFEIDNTKPKFCCFRNKLAVLGLVFSISNIFIDKKKTTRANKSGQEKKIPT